ncbi:serine hydrolase domain-containing protein [Aquimarina longa]|uniref:serine hydrolase domain-containing protein n=1 Tax=Aquimarina longa TaxID=1080221 RepID=UPI000784AA83|nr:serine hydrolase domain-containing protein [Aquimarina longa]
MKKITLIAAPSMFFVALLLSFTVAEQPKLPQKSQDHIVISPEVLIPEENNSLLYKERLVDSITAYFNKALHENKIVGAAVTIVKCDSVIYKSGYGSRNSTLKDTVNENTIFRIGSVSKGFAGILAGIHVEEGLLSWEDKIVDYIPDFQMSSRNQTEKVTLSHILSHTTGLPYHSFTNLVEAGLPITSIASRFKNVFPIGQPGRIYSYQNAVFALSGKIIEEITGKPLVEVIQDKIFKPLEMTSASASYEALDESDNVAQPHKRFRYGWKPIRINKKYYNNAIAAGGINASITDMSKWVRFLLGNNPEVMMPNTMNTVFSPKIQVGGRSKYYQRWPGFSKSSYGLGWRIHTFINKETKQPSTMIHHGGTVNNYRSEIAIYPEEDLGICVLFNSQNSLAKNCIPEIYKIIKEITATIEEEYSKESLIVL